MLSAAELHDNCFTTHTGRVSGSETADLRGQHNLRQTPSPHEEPNIQVCAAVAA